MYNSPMNTPYIQIQTSINDKKEASKIAQQLIQKKAAACVQISGPITSYYEWKNQIETTEEWVCTIKTTQEKYTQVEKIIKENHSYEIPEIIVVPILNGDKEYLEWIHTSCH